MITCKNCGYQMDDDSLFCEQCGAPVSPETGSSTQNGCQSQYQDSYQNDFQNGYQNGYQNDFQNGYQNSCQNGFQNGYQNGDPDDFRNGYPDNFQTPPPAPAARRSRAPIYIAIAAAAVLIIAAGAGLTVWFLSDSSAENTRQTAALQDSDPADDTDSTFSWRNGRNNADSEDGQNDTQEEKKEEKQQEDTDTAGHGNTDSEEAGFPFLINPSADADYTAALDPSGYEFYSSSIDEFNFWYPTDFYNEVTYNAQPDKGQYGTNLEKITFSAKDGSRLIFQAIQRTDSLSLDDMTANVCTSELGRMSSSEVILNHVKDNYGKVIVTGWDNERDGYTDYCLTKIKQDTILRMTVQFPGYTNDDNELRMGYLTETFYRMCGFSDADPWRTYEEYIRENG